jgi:hypothetical protein
MQFRVLLQPLPEWTTPTQARTDTIASDPIYENTILLTRDLLYVVELVDAIQTGDFGRVEDILPALACLFRGAGSNNYSTEILHFIFNVNKVWTPEFVCVLYSLSSLTMRCSANKILETSCGTTCL